MITCERKVRLKLGVLCICILWISRSLFILTIFDHSYQSYAPFYPLANEVAKRYSNTFSVRPSFRNIIVNTLESASFNGFWPNLLYWFPDDNQWWKVRWKLGVVFKYILGVSRSSSMLKIFLSYYFKKHSFIQRIRWPWVSKGWHILLNEHVSEESSSRGW